MKIKVGRTFGCCATEQDEMMLHKHTNWFARDGAV